MGQAGLDKAEGDELEDGEKGEGAERTVLRSHLGAKSGGEDGAPGAMAALGLERRAV